MLHIIIRFIFTAFLFFTLHMGAQMMLEKERGIDLFLTSPIRIHHVHKWGICVENNKIPEYRNSVTI